MPSFDYVALKPGVSEKVSGRIDADTVRDARSKIRLKGETPISITEIKAFGSGLSKLFPTFGQRGYPVEVLMFTTQLASLIRSGITLTDALRVLSDQNTNKNFSNILKLVMQSVVERGSSFADALRAYPKCFSDLYVSMIGAGEVTGTVPEVLSRLAAYAKKKSEIEGKVKAALTYPIIMLVMGFGVVTFLLSNLVPKITPILKSKKEALPKATELLISISDIFENYWWLAIILAIVFTLIYKSFVATEKGRYAVDGLFLRIPVFGDLIRKSAVSRFCITLSSLLKSGVKIESALQIVQQVVGNAVIAEIVKEVNSRIKEGESIAGPLERNGVFPKVVTYMISIGEKAGSEELQEMLDNISESYDLEIQQSAEKLTAMLNPILLMFMAGIVVFILLAILIPIMRMSNSF
jgi:general secretion pathway protein F